MKPNIENYEDLRRQVDELCQRLVALEKLTKHTPSTMIEADDIEDDRDI